MTNEQIAASRDYNYSVLWAWTRKLKIATPAEMVRDHEELVAVWFDHPDPATRQAISYAEEHNWTC